jgi:hypothetical protein
LLNTSRQGVQMGFVAHNLQLRRSPRRLIRRRAYGMTNFPLLMSLLMDFYGCK